MRHYFLEVFTLKTGIKEAKNLKTVSVKQSQFQRYIMNNFLFGLHVMISL